MLVRNGSSDKKAGWRVSTGSFIVLFTYTLFIWWQEALDLLMWLLHMQQGTIVSSAAALFLCGVVVMAVGRFERDKAGVSPLFAVGSLFVFIFFVIKGISPDQSYDTQNYHLLSQIPGFVDNLHYHVIPGRFQMFGFRLGDRMFYLFRLILGLRMGTILNAFAMLVIYRQLTIFFNMTARRMEDFSEEDLSQDRYKKKTKVYRTVMKHLAPVLAFLVASRLELIQESGSYMVELLAIPFFLEMVFLLLRETDEDKAERESILFCLFGGILFCLKMTNIVYLVPLVLLYLWKIRKYLNPKLFFICLFIGVLPVSIYLIYNGIAMKNPVYPYYNSIFRSPYYPESDFKDRRWGPGNIKELLLWAYMMIRYPEYRLSEIPEKHNFDLLLMYLGVAAAALYWFYHWLGGKAKLIHTDMQGMNSKGNDESNSKHRELILFLLYASSFVLWSATTGHSRYFMGGLLIAGMICGCLVIRILRVLFSKREYIIRKASGGLFLIFFMAVYVSRTFYSYSSVLNANEWALRIVNRQNISQNLPYVFHDHHLFTEEELSKIDYIFLTWSDVGSYARLAGENVPVWNRYSIVDELSSDKDIYIEEIENAMEEGKGVYDMFQQGADTLLDYLKWINEAGWYVSDLEYQETILKGSSSFTLAGLEMAHGRENTWYCTKNFNLCETADADDATDENADSEDASGKTGYVLKYTGDDDHPLLKGILCDPDYFSLKYPFQVNIIASDGTNTKTAAVITAGEKEYEPVEAELDLTGLTGDIELSLVSTVDVKRAVLINPEY